MRIKLEENLPRRLKGTLASLQHDVVRVEDELLLAQPDTVVAAAARKENRVLFTLDVEFGDLRKHPPGSHPGRDSVSAQGARRVKRVALC